MERSCRTEASRIGEPLAGTAPTADGLVAVAWPKPRWHPETASRSAGLPRALHSIEVREKQAGRSLAIRVFQRAPGGPTERVEVLFFSSAAGSLTRAREVPVDALPEAIERFLAGDAPGEPLHQPLLLVCTDGKHDRCCAAEGRAFFDALARRATRATGIQLAESSHLGGHRFAATCLQLPGGRLYGRLTAADAPGLLEAVATGRVLTARNRGLLGWPEPVQVAESWASARFPGLRELEWSLGPQRNGTRQVALRFKLGDAPRNVSLTCRERSFLSATSCGGEIEPRSRWSVSGQVDQVG